MAPTSACRQYRQEDARDDFVCVPLLLLSIFSLRVLYY